MIKTSSGGKIFYLRYLYPYNLTGAILYLIRGILCESTALGTYTIAMSIFTTDLYLIEMVFITKQYINNTFPGTINYSTRYLSMD